MHMRMRKLTRRVHVLFEEEDYRILQMIAKEKGVSVAELIRRAARWLLYTKKGQRRKRSVL